MSLCPSCRQLNPDGISVCARCGSPLIDSAPTGTFMMPAHKQDAKLTDTAARDPERTAAPIPVRASHARSASATATDEDATGFGMGASHAAGPVSQPAASSDETRFDVPGAVAPKPGDPTGPLSVGQSFGTRYHIMRLLGLGGMGAVYQAWDSELGVAVALKVVRPEVAADPKAARVMEARFKQELLLARKVTHKNVVRIHDMGTVEGIKYITMPFIEGEELAAILKREGKLPVSRALKIARGIVSGLHAAHIADVVHRDLKPANIMVEANGDAMIMDFGIARSAGPVGGRAGAGGAPTLSGMAASAHTVMGAIVGTVEYMAPEQAKAQPVDQRADIYAFGLIAYDMLLGRRRLQNAESAIAELSGRMVTAPPPPRSIDPQIPEAVDALINKCLQPDPAARFQTTAELEAELNRLDDEGKPLPIVRRLTARLVAAAAAVLLAVMGATYFFAKGPAPVVERPPMSVLVADFENKTGDPVFEGAIEQTLGLAIEGARFVTLYPRVQAQRVAAQIKPGSRLDEQMARTLSRREGIHVVLAGSITTSGSGYDITVRAIDPAQQDTKPLAVATATAASKDKVLLTLGTLAARIRGPLGDTTPESARLAAAETFTTSSPEAVKSYTRGQELLDGGKYDDAIEAYQKAIQRDASFGRAYASLATALYQRGRRDEADQAWKKAVSLTDRMTEREKYRTLGTYYLAVSRNYEKAIETYSTLVKLYPADTSGHGNLAAAYFLVLNFPKALEETRKAVQLAPRNVLFRNNYVLVAMYASDFATAVKEADALIKQEPGFFKNYLPLAVAAMADGRFDVAKEAYAKMAATGPEGSSLAAIGLADMAMYRGEHAEADALLKTAIAEDLKAKNTAGLAAKQIALAESYAEVGQMTRALKAVKEALALDRQENVLVPAADIYLRSGRLREASDLAAELENKLQPQARAYAKIIDGNIALASGRRASALDHFREATKLADFWLARFKMGVTYVEAGHYPEALAELEACQKRRGEATAIFLDENPTFHYLATLPYWLGRAQEGVGQQAAAKANYATFLSLRPESAGDPLVLDARKRSRS